MAFDNERAQLSAGRVKSSSVSSAARPDNDDVANGLIHSCRRLDCRSWIWFQGSLRPTRRHIVTRVIFYRWEPAAASLPACLSWTFLACFSTYPMSQLWPIPLARYDAHRAHRGSDREPMTHPGTEVHKRSDPAVDCPWFQRSGPGQLRFSQSVPAECVLPECWIPA